MYSFVFYDWGKYLVYQLPFKWRLQKLAPCYRCWYLPTWYVMSARSCKMLLHCGQLHVNLVASSKHNNDGRKLWCRFTVDGIFRVENIFLYCSINGAIQWRTNGRLAQQFRVQDFYQLLIKISGVFLDTLSCESKQALPANRSNLHIRFYLSLLVSDQQTC